MTIDWQDALAALQQATSGVASIDVITGGGGYTSVPTITVDPPAPGGVRATGVAEMGVGAIAVTNGGSGYTSTPTVTLVGGSDNATATAKLAPFTVAAVTLKNGGSGYSSPPTVQFSGGGGTGAKATATLSGGQVTGITLTNGGAGYGSSSPPSVALVGGGGFGAQAVATLESTGAVVTAGVTAGGAGYNTIPNVKLTAGGPTTLGIFQANMSGSVSALTLGPESSPGYGGGYTVAPLVTISPPDAPGGGTQALAHTTLTSGFESVLSITLDNAGSGYTKPPTVIIGPPDDPGSSGAEQVTCVATVSTSLISISIVSGGAGYTGTPNFTIDAPPAGGTQATATATVAASSIKSIQVTSAGQGYTSAPTVDIGAPSGGVQATATAASSPVVVSSVAVTSPGTGYTSAPSVSFLGGGGSGATATVALAPTSVASVQVNLHGSGYGYTSPPAVVFSGGGGLGAAAAATLQLEFVRQIVGGYLYGTNPNVAFPNVTVASVDGNGSGATASAVLSVALTAGETFSLAQANDLIAELANVGAQYAAGQPPTVAAAARSYRVPAAVNWGEVDKATRFAAAQSSAWFSWPASWAMSPSSDPGVVMVQRANLLSAALAAYVTGGGVPDPFFAQTWSPLYALAVPAYAYFIQQQSAAAASATTPYDDSSSLGVRLQALVTRAIEMADYLTSL